MSKIVDLIEASAHREPLTALLCPYAGRQYPPVIKAMINEDVAWVKFKEALIAIRDEDSNRHLPPTIRITMRGGGQFHLLSDGKSWGTSWVSY